MKLWNEHKDGGKGKHETEFWILSHLLLVLGYESAVFFYYTEIFSSIYCFTYLAKMELDFHICLYIRETELINILSRNKNIVRRLCE